MGVSFGAATVVRWRTAGVIALLLSHSSSVLVGLCDRLGGGHTRWVSEGVRASARSSVAPLAVRPLGRDLFLADHSERQSRE